jgi:hypothetical protein
MNMQQLVVKLMKDSVRDPVSAVPQLLALRLPLEARWIGLGIVVALSGISTVIAGWLFPLPVDTPWAGITSSPIRMAMIQGLGMIFVAAAMAYVGQMFRGKGQFRDALLLAVWTEAILLVLQFVQLAMMVLFPFVASLLALVSFVLLFWLISGFTMGLHGFKSRAAVLIGLIATLFVAGTIFMIILGAIGLAPIAGV